MTTQAVYFGVDDALFGQVHRPAGSNAKAAVVICNPVGYEYIRSYRVIRHFAEQLCEQGHFTLRFDYQTTGDSAGSDSDSGRLSLLISSIEQAIAFARTSSGAKQVVLIGLRLGANLAARVAERTEVAGLVLWAPCDSGAIYVREQQIMASAQLKRTATDGGKPDPDNGVDAGGFYLTKETQDELQALKFAPEPFQGEPAILALNRDDIRSQPRFLETLRTHNPQLTTGVSHGFKDMMLPPQLSTVPQQTISEILEWIGSNLPEAPGTDAFPADTTWTTKTVIDDDVVETAVRFGPDNGLFGIISTPSKSRSSKNFGVVLLCGGAPHRISANRMYVSIARRLAAHGIASIRMDLSGIGDSMPRPGYVENKPYTDVLRDDVEAAMDALADVCDVSQFKLFGLCSGAYAAMQAATSERVIDLVLANQLVYYLTAKELADLASGKYRSAHDLDFPRSDSFLYKVVVKILQRIPAAYNWPGEWLSRYLVGGALSRDINALVSHGTHLAFVQSSQDDAVTALHTAAGRTVRRLQRSGKAKLEVFKATDHTFSPRVSQQQLSDWLLRYLQDDERAS